MSNEKQTAVEWLYLELFYFLNGQSKFENAEKILERAKEMEKKQQGYSKVDVLRAAEMGEVNHIDAEHIVSYLDEAKKENE